MPGTWFITSWILVRFRPAAIKGTLYSRRNSATSRPEKPLAPYKITDRLLSINFLSFLMRLTASCQTKVLPIRPRQPRNPRTEYCSLPFHRVEAHAPLATQEAIVSLKYLYCPVGTFR